MRQRTLVTLLATVLPAIVLAQRDRPPVQLPDGEAKAMIEAVCVACHRLDFIPNSVGSTHDGWQQLISSMITLPGDIIAAHLHIMDNRS